MKKIKLNATLVLFLGIFVAGISNTAQVASAKSFNDRIDKIPGQYIVVFKDKVADADSESDKIAKTHKLERIHTYNRAIKGFTARMSEAELEKIKNDPRVEFVTEDRAIYISNPAFGSESSLNKAPSISKKPAPQTQPPQTVPTGIDRVNAENLLNKGAGIGVAVIDTGIELSHPDLKGNIIANKNCLSGVKNGNDDNGHGTHTAGTIAALDNNIGVVGAAPEAKFINIVK